MRAKDGMRTGGEILIDQLAIHGVRHVFCVPGESYHRGARCVPRRPDRGHHLPPGGRRRHHGGGRRQGDRAARHLLRHARPGRHQCVGGLHIARQDSTPMILFVGQIARDMREREAFQELDYRAVFGTIAKWVTEIDDPARIPELISRAFYTATNGRPGPGRDRAAGGHAGRARGRAGRAGFRAGRDRRRARPTWSSCKRCCTAPQHPIVLAGGSRWSEAASAELVRFAERFAMPVATTFRRAQLFDQLHPMYAGDLGIGANPKLVEHIKASDLVILLGGRLGEMPSQRYTLLDIPGPARADVRARASRRRGAWPRLPPAALPSTPRRPRSRRRSTDLVPPNDLRWRDDAKALHAAYLAWTEKPTAVPGAGQSRRDRRGLARKAARRRGDLQRRRQFLDLGAPLSPLSPLRHASLRPTPAPWATACRPRSR